jgi:hypothetical protein
MKMKGGEGERERDDRQCLPTLPDLNLKLSKRKGDKIQLKRGVGEHRAFISSNVTKAVAPIYLAT